VTTTTSTKNDYYNKKAATRTTTSNNDKDKNLHTATTKIQQHIQYNNNKVHLQTTPITINNNN